MTASLMSCLRLICRKPCRQLRQTEDRPESIDEYNGYAGEAACRAPRKCPHHVGPDEASPEGPDAETAHLPRTAAADKPARSRTFPSEKNPTGMPPRATLKAMFWAQRSFPLLRGDQRE